MNEITTREKLRNRNNNELKALILDLAKLRKENLEWLQAKLNGEECIDETLAYYKKKIKNSLQLGRIKLSEAKKAITDFKKISKKPEYILELMLFYVETGIEIENEFGDEFVADLIIANKEQFITSSTLKYNLKKEGIIIQNIKGELNVEVAKDT